MKKRIINLCLFLGILLSTNVTLSQSEGTVSLNSYQLDEPNNRVLISIKTAESFIVGANRYVLHIGGRHFLLSEHPEGRLDEIIFYVPLADYKVLIEQSQIVLVYGFYHENTLQDGEGNGANGFTGKHWLLGKFNHEVLLKN